MLYKVMVCDEWDEEVVFTGTLKECLNFTTTNKFFDMCILDINNHFVCRG